MNDKPKYLIESEIAVRKQMLAGTDYQALKFAEGAISNEDYASMARSDQRTGSRACKVPRGTGNLKSFRSEEKQL